MQNSLHQALRLGGGECVVSEQGDRFLFRVLCMTNLLMRPKGLGGDSFRDLRQKAFDLRNRVSVFSPPYTIVSVERPELRLLDTPKILVGRTRNNATGWSGYRVESLAV